MHKNKLITAFLALSLGAGYAFARPTLQDEESTPLQESMQGLMSNQRAMRKLVGDATANQSDLLELLGEFRGHALTAFSLPPETPKRLEGTDAAVWRVAFQRQVLQLVDASLECELAVHKGDSEALGEAYKRLGGIKKTGHDRFKKD
jgi:hypothetical protein